MLGHDPPLTELVRTDIVLQHKLSLAFLVARSMQRGYVFDLLYSVSSFSSLEYRCLLPAHEASASSGAGCGKPGGALT